MPRFLCRLHVEVRGGPDADPATPPAPFKLESSDRTAVESLGPLVVVAKYTAAQDVTAADAVAATGKVQVFASNNVAGLVPVGGRVAQVHIEAGEWPT